MPDPQRSTSEPTIPASSAPDSSAGSPTVGLGGGGANSFSPSGSSIESQDLTRDPLLSNVTRLTVNGVERPTLGGIQLVAKLGQGGMGAVYYGVNPRLETEVAIKILPLANAQQQASLVERFLREARIAAKVKSPHIAAVYDVNMEHGIFYIQMEYVDGASAGSHMRQTLSATRRGLPETIALDICIAACEGLAAAHAEGIIHRDIKPDNIMIPRHRRGADSGSLNFPAAKLLDLGLARSVQTIQGRELTLNDTGMGTPGYMPPEQAQDARSAREPADVYSLGATLYALLTGHAPFRGDTPLNVAMATISKPHEPIENSRRDLHPKTIDLIHRCLQKDPLARPANGAMLLADMRDCRKAVSEPPATVLQPAPVAKSASAPLAVQPPAKTPAPQASAAAARPRPASTPSPRPQSPPAPAKKQASGANWIFIVLAAMFVLFVTIAVVLVLVGVIMSADDKNGSGQNNTIVGGGEDEDALALAESIYPPFEGTVTEVRVSLGAAVRHGDALVVIQDTHNFGTPQVITSPRAGVVRKVYVQNGDHVTKKSPLVHLPLE